MTKTIDALVEALTLIRGKHGCGALTLPMADLDRVDAALAQARAEHPVLNFDLTGQALIDNYEAVGRVKRAEQERADFIDFLNGEGTYQGVWFNGTHPTERGAFWWRTHLRRLFGDQT